MLYASDGQRCPKVQTGNAGQLVNQKAKSDKISCLYGKNAHVNYLLVHLLLSSAGVRVAAAISQIQVNLKLIYLTGKQETAHSHTVCVCG